MAVISINGITIPHVKGGENQGFEEFADMGMTAGGLRRKDVLTIKRTWSYETNPILRADAVTILNSLRTAMFQDVPFANDFDANFAAPVQCYVKVDRTRARGTRTTYSNELQILKFTITER